MICNRTKWYRKDGSNGIKIKNTRFVEPYSKNNSAEFQLYPSYSSRVFKKIYIYFPSLGFLNEKVPVEYIWAASWQNQQSGMCAQQRLRSAWASVQSDQSSLCAHWVAKDPSFLHADSEDSDQTGYTVTLLVLSLSYNHCGLDMPLDIASSVAIKKYLSRDMTKPTKWVCAQRRLGSASLIRVFAVFMKNAGILSYPLSAQRILWSDWADAQADLSLRWAHTPFVGFVMSRLIFL